MNKKFGIKSKLFSVVISTFSVGAFAAEGNSGNAVIDYKQLTNAIDFGDVMVGVLAAGAALMAVYAGIVGVRYILRIVRSA